MNPRTLLTALTLAGGAMLAATAALAGCLVVVGADGHSFKSAFAHGPTGSGVLGEDHRDVGDFQGVALHGSGDLRVHVGDDFSVVVRCDDDLFDYVVTEVEGDTLYVYTEGNAKFRHGPEVHVTAPALKSASISGSGDVRVEGVDAGKFSASVSGSGDLSVKGRADKVDASINGSGDLHLKGLEAAVGSVRISGSGDVYINASQHLSVAISGSGDVHYVGNPERDVDVSGSGDVSRVK